MKSIAAPFFALAILGLASTANAQTLVWTLPTPADITAFMQNAQIASQTCAPIEVAPGVMMPIPCFANLPKPPVDAPDAASVLPAQGIVPFAVDLRTQNLVGPVKDQAQVGVCWSFAISTVLENSLRRQGRPEVLAPLHVIAADTWTGIWGRGSKEPLAMEASWPYEPRKACELDDRDGDCGRTYGVKPGSWRSNPVLVGERERARVVGVARAGQARVLKGDQISQIATALASGRAVYASVGIDGSAWDFRGARNGVLAPYGNETRGGHAVTIIGYRTLGTRQFLIQNSWGRSWGEGGYVWITEPELRRHLRDAFVLDASPVVAPSPPTPTLTIPIQRCPSGLPAFLGQCWLG
jgi:hypothetical protein